METMKTNQYLFTVAAGKRLIAKAVASLPSVRSALSNGTILVLGGTTNGYVAQELLEMIGQTESAHFTKKGFYRGVTVAPGYDLKQNGGDVFPGDLVIEKGKASFGKTVFEVAEGLKKGDVVIKGANAVDADRKLAGILIGHPQIGTSGPILQAAVGRRVELILPVGLEKRVLGDIAQIARRLNAPTSSGARMLPVAGTIVTELEAVGLLTGCVAELAAAGGIYGAEGSCWIAVTGTADQIEKADRILGPITSEPSFPGE